MTTIYYGTFSGSVYYNGVHIGSYRVNGSSEYTHTRDVYEYTDSYGNCTCLDDVDFEGYFEDLEATPIPELNKFDSEYPEDVEVTYRVRNKDSKNDNSFDISVYRTMDKDGNIDYSLPDEDEYIELFDDVFEMLEFEEEDFEEDSQW